MSFWRQAAFCLAAFYAFLCCGLAVAQDRDLIDDLPRARPALPRDVLINDLPPVAGVIKGAPPPKTPLEQFRERLEQELNFVGRACQLSPEEREALGKAGDEIVERFKPLLEKQPPAAHGERMVALNNGQVVVLDARGGVQTLIPDRLLQAQVDIAVQGSLTAKRLATLEAQRERLEQKARQAHVLGLLAAVDDAMLLTDEERQRLAAYLDANWKAVWGQVVSGSQLTAPGATPLQTGKARGLGGVFDLFDADLEPILRPAQVAAWREMRALRIVNSPVLPNGVLWKGRNILVQGAARARIVRNANGQNVLIREGGAAAPVQVPIQGGLAVNGRRPFAAADPAENPNLPVFKPAKELTLLLNLLVENAALAGGLTDEQRETLLLAGMLDIRRYAAEREQEWQEMLQHADVAPGNRHIAVRAETAAASNPFAEATSRFRKALASRLSEEQLARLAEVERKRRELRREAAVASVVREFDEVAKLTSKQWNALADALRRRLPPLSGAATQDDSLSEALACMSGLGKTDLQPIVDEDQWPAAEQKLIELKQTAARLQP
ncbi:MAG TPA: hypothetical protein VMV10_13190 [Pirellulales bacterium]|nr:hypothetical protein [Pirellulales bacterium]